MTVITVREVRPGDGEALALIHRDIAVYYAELAPEHLHVPMLEGIAEELDRRGITRMTLRSTYYRSPQAGSPGPVAGPAAQPSGLRGP